MRPRSNGATASFLQRLIHIWPRYLERWNQCEHEGTENRGDKCEGKDWRVNRDFAKTRNILRTENAKKIDSPPGNEQTGDGAENR